MKGVMYVSAGILTLISVGLTIGSFTTPPPESDQLITFAMEGTGLAILCMIVGRRAR